MRDALGFFRGEVLRCGPEVGHDGTGCERERVRKHGAGGTRTEDEAFEQGIGCEAIGAMNAGARGLAGGVEAAEAGASDEIGADAAH